MLQTKGHSKHSPILTLSALFDAKDAKEQAACTCIPRNPASCSRWKNTIASTPLRIHDFMITFTPFNSACSESHRESPGGGILGETTSEDRMYRVY